MSRSVPVPCGHLWLSPPSSSLGNSDHPVHEARGCRNEILCPCQDTGGFVANLCLSCCFLIFEGNITGMMPRSLSPALDLTPGRVHQHAHPSPCSAGLAPGLQMKWYFFNQNIAVKELTAPSIPWFDAELPAVFFPTIQGFVLNSGLEKKKKLEKGKKKLKGKKKSPKELLSLIPSSRTVSFPEGPRILHLIK